LNLGASFVSTRRLFEPLIFLKKVGILKDFDLRGTESWFAFQFPKSSSIIKKLQAYNLLDVTSSSAKVMSVSLKDGTHNEINIHFKGRLSRAQRKPQSKGVKSEVYLKNPNDKKSLAFKNYYEQLDKNTALIETKNPAAAKKIEEVSRESRRPRGRT
jgi:hypothetical protein